jgi:alpha-tubulin suppressor-like RCC1 family protein
VNLGTGRTAKAVATRYDTTCAWLDNNQVKCWGANFGGQAGQGNTTNQLSPPSATVNLGTSQSALAIAVGSYHSCALMATNQVKCWGVNDAGQLGTWQDMSSGSDPYVGDSANEMGDFLAAVYQGAGRSVKAVTAGFTHTCFLLDSNQVRCDGTNSSGELGQGNTNVYNPFGQGAGLVDLGVDP